MLCGVQVRGAGTGIRRHRLFFLGFKLKDDSGGSRNLARSWRWGRGRRAQAAAAAAAAQPPAPAARFQKAGGMPSLATVQQGGVAALAGSDAWLDAYYGGGAAVNAAAAAAAAAVGAVEHKVTSVRLAVVDDPGGAAPIAAGSVNSGSELQDAPEAPDVAAERAPVEALWPQW